MTKRKILQDGMQNKTQKILLQDGRVP